MNSAALHILQALPTALFSPSSGSLSGAMRHLADPTAEYHNHVHLTLYAFLALVILLFYWKVCVLQQRGEYLEREAQRYSMHLEHFPWPTLIHVNGHIVEANQATADLTGHESPDELIGTDILDYVPPEHRELVLQRVDDLNRGMDMAAPTVMRFIGKGGKEIVAEAASTAITWHGRRAVQAVFKDMTTDAVHVQQLQSVREEYRTLFENATEGIYRARLDSSIVDANPRLAEIFGFSDVEALKSAQTMRSFYLDPTRRELLHTLLSERGRVEEFTSQALRRDGSVIWIVESAHLHTPGPNAPYDGQEPVVEATVRDITAMKEHEAAQNALLAEKDIMLKELHHRVKNNLQIISSLLQLQAARDMPSSSTAHGTDDESSDCPVETLVAQSQNRLRSMALVHSMLMESDQIDSIDLSQYLQRLIGSFGGADGVAIQLDTMPIQMGLDRAVLCGLIVNELMTNLLYHATSADSSSGPTPCTIALRCTPDTCELDFSDRGPGLPDDVLRGERSGLGLELVRSLAEQLGGTATLANAEDGRGARVRVSFVL